MEDRSDGMRWERRGKKRRGREQKIDLKRRMRGWNRSDGNGKGEKRRGDRLGWERGRV